MTITKARWAMIEREHRLGHLSIVALADRHGVNPNTIHERARKYTWHRHGSAADDPDLRARIQTDIAFERVQSVLDALHAGSADLKTLRELAAAISLLTRAQNDLAALRKGPSSDHPHPFDATTAEKTIADIESLIAGRAGTR